MGTASVTVTVTPDCDAGTVPIDAGASADAGAGLQLLQTTYNTYTGITVGVVQGSTAYWTDWTAMASGTVSGVLSLPTGDVQVTYTATDFYGAQTTTGGNLWLPASTFTSATVPNAPPGPGMVQISGGATQFDSVTFSRPVTNPIVAIFSLGTSSVPPAVSIDFKDPFALLTSGPDVFGGAAGTPTLTEVDAGVSGMEGSGLVEVMGTF